MDYGESAQVFRVPVRDLLDPDNRVMATVTRAGQTFQSPAFTVNDVVVWGFTGMILNQLFDQLGWAVPWDRTRLLGIDAWSRPTAAGQRLPVTASWPAASWPLAAGSAARRTCLRLPGGLSTTSPVAAFSRTAVMPAAAPLMVLNSGETATTVPSGAVSLKKYVFSPACAISNVPANVLPPQILCVVALPGGTSRITTGLFEGNGPRAGTTLPAGTLRRVTAAAHLALS